MYDIVIVGAGPAGMTAALYAARSGRSVLMIEKLGYGGQIINTPEVENYPGIGKTSGYELAEKMYGQAIELGAELEYDEIVSVERTTAGFELTGESKKVYQARSVIFATGVTARHLGIDRENDLVGRGVSYCATCDGAFFKGRDVIVVGGGNTALEDAEYMSAIAPKELFYVLHHKTAALSVGGFHWICLYYSFVGYGFNAAVYAGSAFCICGNSNADFFQKHLRYRSCRYARCAFSSRSSAAAAPIAYAVFCLPRVIGV